jgi:hypothetical protein
MAGIVEKPVTSGINYGGMIELGNGLMAYHGTGAFTTTGTTVTIYHPFGTQALFTAQVTALKSSGAAVANGALTISGYSRDTTYGTFKSSTSGQLSVTRAAGTDSALEFSVYIVGRARH